jgi:membrane protein
MNQRTRRTITVVRAIVHEVRTERITFMAGSIAYHAFVSLLPLLLLVLAVVSAIGRPGIERGIIDLARATLTPGAADILVGELQTTSPGVSLLGLVVLIWGTLRIFRGLDTAFSDIYESEARNTLVDQVRDGLVVFVCVAAAILVSAVLDQALSFGGTAGWVAGRVVLVVGLGLAFLPMYYVFPDQEGMPVREVLPGVAFAAVGLTVFESAFRLYISTTADAASGDVLAGILVFLTWLYFSGLVLLVGVAINAVLSNRSRDVNIRPVIGGVPREGARADGHTAGTIDRATLVAAVEQLRADLPASETLTVTVDGETVELPPPEQVAVDLQTSMLPFVTDSVSLELRWSPEESE